MGTSKTYTKSNRIFQFNSTQPEVKYLVIATIRSSNMKSCAMASFVFFIVAITMIAMAKGGITGVCKEWLDEIADCSKGNEAEACCRELGIPDLCFGYCQTE